MVSARSVLSFRQPSRPKPCRTSEGRIKAPAGFMKSVAGKEPVKTSSLSAPLGLHGLSPARTISHGAVETSDTDAVFGLNGKSAAKRVEPEQGIGTGNQGNIRDRILRNQIPADHIAERLILAHSIEINGNSFRRAERGDAV